MKDLKIDVERFKNFFRVSIRAGNGYYELYRNRFDNVILNFKSSKPKKVRKKSPRKTTTNIVRNWEVKNE